MAKNESHASKGTLTQSDDFKLIHGIGAGLEARLHTAGILTYTQLAAMTPETISSALGNVIGLTVKRIDNQDWIGQSRELQSQREQPPTEAQSNHSRAERQHYATFTIELLLGTKNEVRRTRIVHIQNQAEESWAGWEQARVVDFIVSRAELHLPKTELIQSGTDLVETIPPESPQALLSGNPRLEELVAISRAEDSPRRLLSANQLFGVRMIMNISEVTLPKGNPLEYSTTIFAKKLGRGDRIPIGNAKGSCGLEERVTIDIDGANLQEGVYRLGAEIFLKQVSEKATLESGLTTQLEGGLLRIY